MPEVEDLPLRAQSPLEERNAAAMERQAEEQAATAKAHARLAEIMAQTAGAEPTPYRRHAYFWAALMTVVQSGQSASVVAALNAADELVDGFELRHPEYVSPAQP